MIESNSKVTNPRDRVRQWFLFATEEMLEKAFFQAQIVHLNTARQCIDIAESILCDFHPTGEQAAMIQYGSYCFAARYLPEDDLSKSELAMLAKIKPIALRISEKIEEQKALLWIDTEVSR